MSALVGGAGLTGCAAPGRSDTVSVSGTASQMARIALPPEAVLTVRIEDVSVADRVAPVLAEVSEAFGARQVPIPFTLQVPKARIDPKARYALRAEIRVDGQRRFITDTHVPVLGADAPPTHTLLLVPAAAAAAPRWRGAFSYFADAAHFVDCASGQRWPVANAGDYLAAERAYLAARSAPGEPVLMVFEGRVEMRPSMEGPPREQLVIDRLGGVEPGATCPAPASPPLRGTAWRLVELDGAAVAAAPAQARPLGLSLSAREAQASAYAGCNPLVGGFETQGNTLRFSGLASSMMACDEAVMARERQLAQALTAVSAFRMTGRQLSLLAGERVVARFSAEP